MLRHVRPCAVGQALPDLGSHDHTVSSADVLDFIIHRQNLDTADLGDNEDRRRHEERERGMDLDGWMDGRVDGWMDDSWMDEWQMDDGGWMDDDAGWIDDRWMMDG